MTRNDLTLMSIGLAAATLLLAACGASDDAPPTGKPTGKSAEALTCTPIYIVKDGSAGPALNELWPNDGGIYCEENVNSQGCVGNYCGENEGWTTDPQLQAPPKETCTTLYVVKDGSAGPALNELWPNDGGKYCKENVNSQGCVGNYCGENQGWTTDPQLQAQQTETCTTLYVVKDGSAGPALNELWPNDGGKYCKENVNSQGCVGNYCGENEDWTTDPQLQAQQTETCTTLYVVKDGSAGPALNELWPNDGGIYCEENVNSQGCVGNYCGENEDWTTDPQLQAPPKETCTTLYVVKDGSAGPALNELWPNDGGKYCKENVNSQGCVGNYCGENEDWTLDPNFRSQ